MPKDNEKALQVTRETIAFVSNAFRRSIRRLSSRKKTEMAKDGERLAPLAIPEESEVLVVEEKKERKPEYIVKLKSNEKGPPLRREASLRLKRSPFTRSEEMERETLTTCLLALHDCHLAALGPCVSRFMAQPHKVLTSFENRRRFHQHFGAALHAKQTLFCPEQASQIEIEVLATDGKEFVVQIAAPNGEISSPLPLHTKQAKSAKFSPSKVGCGHGIWRLEVYERVHSKFEKRSTLELNLRGCGLLVYKADLSGNLIQQSRLWLDLID